MAKGKPKKRFQNHVYLFICISFNFGLHKAIKLVISIPKLIKT